MGFGHGISDRPISTLTDLTLLFLISTGNPPHQVTQPAPSYNEELGGPVTAGVHTMLVAKKSKTK